MDKNIYLPRLTSVRGALIAFATLAALWLGLMLATPAQGAPLGQDAKGDITGQVTVNGQTMAGITVELRQRNNGGQDATISTATTDGTGTYHFPNEPSAPNDAFYYIHFSGGKNTLAAWYSFPIIYIMSSQVTVPSVDVGDVEVVRPAQNATLSLPGKLEWNARRMGETYRVFVYAAGKYEKPVIDSGSLGTGTEFSISEGALQPGQYEAIVQVRDAVAGYGQSQSRFHFSVGDAAQTEQNSGQASGTVKNGDTATTPAQQQQPSPQQSGDNKTNPDAATGNQAPSQSPEQNTGQASPEQAAPDIQLNLSADKTAVDKGTNITYKVELQNNGKGAASGVVVTDKLPDGVGVDASGVKASGGTVTVNGSTVTINVGDVPAGAKTTIEIPAKVATGADKHISNQASATYAGASDAVQSNAYIAEVAEPVSGPAQQPQAQQPAQQPAQQQSAPAANQPAASQSSGAQSPQKSPAQSQQVPAKAGNTAPQSKAEQAPKAPTQGNAQSAVPKSQANANVGAKAAAPAEKKANAPVPQTGGSFPIVLALLLLVVTLLARYLRGFVYRRA